MRKIILSLSALFIMPSVFAQWTTSGTNIYNSNTGNVGIGTTSPTAALHIAGTAHPTFTVGVSGNMANSVSQFESSLAVLAANSSSSSSNGAVAWDFYNNGTSPSWAGALLEYFGSAMTGNQSGVPAANMAQLLFQNVSNGLIASNGANIIISPLGTPSTYFLTNGSVGIGTGSTYSYKLAVNGSAIFTQVVVKLNANWPDYVFKRAYKLPALKDIAEYVRINGHLPGLPSAENIRQTGLDLGNTEAKLLQKIEELTLYAIDLQKKVEKLETANNEIAAKDQRMDNLQRQIDELKDLLKK